MKYNNIPFKDFLSTFNFGSIIPELDYNDDEYYSSKIVRVYLPEECSRRWFEIGIQNHRGTYEMMSLFETILKDDILDMYVSVIWYDEDIEEVCVQLTEEKEWEG